MRLGVKGSIGLIVLPTLPSPSSPLFVCLFVFQNDQRLVIRLIVSFMKPFLLLLISRLCLMLLVVS